ncbi:MAG: hypothetical protein U0T81_17435 [Saprospiraceae bacterium]
MIKIELKIRTDSQQTAKCSANDRPEIWNNIHDRVKNGNQNGTGDATYQTEACGDEQA